MLVSFLGLFVVLVVLSDVHWSTPSFLSVRATQSRLRVSQSAWSELPFVLQHQWFLPWFEYFCGARSYKSYFRISAWHVDVLYDYFSVCDVIRFCKLVVIPAISLHL